MVVGDPIEHSLSPQIHEAFAQQFGTQINYQKVRLTAQELPGYFDHFWQHGGVGANVTVPLKTHAFNYAQSLDRVAQTAGAVNTLLVREGKVHGFNTDGEGLVRDLLERHQLKLSGQHILLLGAGGASQGVLAPLLACAPKRIEIANRTRDKALKLAAQFDTGTVPVVGLGFDQIAHQPDVIINATSLSLSAEADVPLAPKWVRGRFCYDMSYGQKAMFQRWARKHGAAESRDGLGMLVEQAAVAYTLWRSDKPQTQPVYDMLRLGVAADA